jgi:hypothetical protein
LKVEIVFNPSPLPLSQRERGIKPFSLRGERSEGGEAGWDEGRIVYDFILLDVFRDNR